MKKIASLLLVAIFTFPVFSQQYFSTPKADGHPVLVLMNPTVNNLKTVTFLIEQQILSLPENYHLVGFYHTSQAYDFQAAADFIVKTAKKNFFLQECTDLPGDAIWAENPCSDDYQKVFEGSKGVIFFGGPDIPPSLYGQETNLLTEITDYHRHTFEASFLFHLLGGYQNKESAPLLEQKPDYMIVGICLGMQTMNVATGGTLIQDIPSQIYGQSTVEQALNANTDDRHRNYFTNLGLDNDLIWGSFHRIKINADKIQAWISPSDSTHPIVLSSHHQAAGSIGKGLIVAATSLDGKVVEALIHETFPNVIGLQFHPEPSFLYRKEEKISLQPGQPATQSYIDLYGTEKGENFNRNLWKWVGNTIEDL
ncbi:MAG: gamma-glutamyl-gamma-aminobutyrate hydrolase family protein [Lentimicrobium sp.]|jgi:putative glutamine amidotransferase|nr:gamma-glutamyl-gamma-aminobutyrate hydrolase family protein [Lentimicrobium sp.]